MQDVGIDNSDQSDSSTSRVDLDILHQKDRIIDFIEFMNKRAEETKDEVLKRKAIEYWNWNEPIIEELQTPDRKLKPIVIYGDKNLWGSPSFWEKKHMAEVIEEAEEEDDEDVSYGDNSYSPLQKYLHEMERVDMGRVEKKLLEEEPSALELAAAEEEEEDDDEEEEEDEEDDDEEMFVDDYVYCYKSCVASPDGFVSNSAFRKNCFHPDQERLILEMQLKKKFTYYIKQMNSTVSTASQRQSKSMKASTHTPATAPEGDGGGVSRFSPAQL